jgi:hypothetical protein
MRRLALGLLVAVAASACGGNAHRPPAESVTSAPEHAIADAIDHLAREVLVSGGRCLEMANGFYRWMQRYKGPLPSKLAAAREGSDLPPEELAQVRAKIEDQLGKVLDAVSRCEYDSPQVREEWRRIDAMLSR